MIKKSTWLHLRIPFSFYLMPIFLFAWCVADTFDVRNSLIAFIILHIFLYPASNAYNSYFDKDKESIGGLKNPPPVSKELYYTALFFDLVAIVLGLLISWQFALILFIYGLVSKAYSHPSVRIKKHALGSWFIAGFFQGFFTFVMASMAIMSLGFEAFYNLSIVYPAVLSSLMLWGSYPMTQIYQHKEDGSRGDRTLSLKLGVLGTFYFTGIFFSLSTALFALYFAQIASFSVAIIYLLFLTPVLIYFLKWFFDVRKDLAKANFRNTMNLNLISSIFLNVFFIWLRFYSY